MKSIMHYREFDKKVSESIGEHIQTQDPSEKKLILNYLRHNTYFGIQCHTLYDYIADESTGKSVRIWTDGEYAWTDEEIYHYEKYNVDLDAEFIGYVNSHRRYNWRSDRRQQNEV